MAESAAKRFTLLDAACARPVTNRDGDVEYFGCFPNEAGTPEKVEVMRKSFPLSIAGGALIICGLSGMADAAPCDASLTQSLQGAGRQIASMPVTKPGQARVLAADGAEYTAGAVRRMTAEYRLAEQACSRGDAHSAEAYLEEIRGTLRPTSP